jgi:hypothetical protein
LCGRGASAGESKCTTGEKSKPSRKASHRSNVKPTRGYALMLNKDLKERLVSRGLSGSGNRAQLIERLEKSDVEISVLAKRKAEYVVLSLLQWEELREVFEDFDAMDERIADLREYRSHLAWHVAEEKFAAKELENLANNEAIVISNYKMRILACYFREAQSKWFGSLE